MPSIDVGGCLSTYWPLWTMNGVSTIIGLVTHMVLSYVLLNYFSKLAKSKAAMSKKKKRQTDFSEYRSNSPVAEMPNSTWNTNFDMTYPGTVSYA